MEINFIDEIGEFNRSTGLECLIFMFHYFKWKSTFLGATETFIRSDNL